MKELVKMFPNAKFIYLMRNPYTVFESTRSFFYEYYPAVETSGYYSCGAGAEHPVCLCQNFTISMRRTRQVFRLVTLIEVKFEDFESRCDGNDRTHLRCAVHTRFADARGAIEQYVGGKKGYKKNKYKYDDRTVRLVQENWGFCTETMEL